MYALVLAILCDFKERSEREVIHYILQRLKELNQNNENRYREYLRMVEILSSNRGLEQLIEEEERMLTQIDQTKLPSYRIGMQQGMQQGEGKLLLRLIIRRFGEAPEWAKEQIQQATEQQLEEWGEHIFDAESIEALFESQH